MLAEAIGGRCGMLQVDGGQVNRIGDALCAIPWLAFLAGRHGGVRVVDDMLSPEVRPLLPGTLGLRFGPGRDDDSPVALLNLHTNFVYCNSGPGRGLHMCHGYFALAGERAMPDLPIDLGLLDDPAPWRDKAFARMAVVSPFSYSDHDHNKAWFEDRWRDVVDAILRHPAIDGVGVLGAERDDPSPYLLSDAVMPVRGLPLRAVLGLLRRCRLLVSVDNGISHLAHFGGVARHLLLAPACLPERFVANPRGRMLRGHPIDLRSEAVAAAALAMLDAG